VIAHIVSVPVEEVLPALMSGMGAWLLLKVSTLRSHPRVRRGAERNWFWPTRRRH
jgi:hypothetical protein